MDDPTSSLDNQVIQKIMKELFDKEPWDKKTYIIATNNIKLINAADRLVYLSEGRVEFVGSRDEASNHSGLSSRLYELSQDGFDAADNVKQTRKTIQKARTTEDLEDQDEEEETEEMQKKQQKNFLEPPKEFEVTTTQNLSK